MATAKTPRHPRRSVAPRVGVRARARGARHRLARGALRPLHRRRAGRAALAEVVRDDLPVDRGASRRGRAGGRPRRRPRRAGGARRLRGRLVVAAPGRAREVPLPDRAPDPGALARARGRGVARRRQADQGVARRRHPARGGALLLLRGLGRQARVRVPEPPPAPARRRRPDHPLELPAADARLEDRAGARLRQHGRAQAGRDDAADRADLHRHLPPGRAAAGRRQHRHRRRLHRRASRQAPRPRQGRVHRLDRGGQGDPARARRHRHQADARARRQGRQHRLRRLRARPGGRGDRQRHLLQPGPRLLRRARGCSCRSRSTSRSSRS